MSAAIELSALENESIQLLNSNDRRKNIDFLIIQNWVIMLSLSVLSAAYYQCTGVRYVLMQYLIVCSIEWFYLTLFTWQRYCRYALRRSTAGMSLIIAMINIITIAYASSMIAEISKDDSCSSYSPETMFRCCWAFVPFYSMHKISLIYTIYNSSHA